MFRFVSLLLVLLLCACGSQEATNSTTEEKAGKENSGSPEKANTDTTPKRPLGEMIQNTWAPSGKEANSAETRTLLVFTGDGKLGYYVFNGKGWDNTPGTYTLEGDMLKDNEGQTYKVIVTDKSLTLDNIEDGKTDFRNWHPAGVEDWDPVDKIAPNPIQNKAP